MVGIEEIPVEHIEEFWRLHIRYLIDDGIVEDEEDREYFASAEYRDVIRAHMLRERDRHHIIYFLRGGKRIGAAQYNTYQNEGGKCFILDFWVFPEYRGNGADMTCLSLSKNNVFCSREPPLRHRGGGSLYAQVFTRCRACRL